MPANFNNSAWFYDRLARMVYGRALVNAQVYLLQFILPNAKILIVGGGTGWILEEITKIHPCGLHITYAEVAADMMALSKKRNTGDNEVVFINDAIENVVLPTDFDVVLTPFLFDNFTGPTLIRVFNHIQQHTKSDVTWLNASFQLTGRWWQHILLRSMFLFFKILCHIEATSLPEIGAEFAKYGYKSIGQQTFFKRFIISTAFKR